MSGRLDADMHLLIDVPEVASDLQLVLHRDFSGTVYAAHSPLELSPLECKVCELGTRVYLA